MNTKNARVFRSFLIIFITLLVGCANMQPNNGSVGLPRPIVQQPQKVALLLPLQGQYSGSAQAIRNGFLAAYYHDKQRNPNIPSVTVLDTSGKDVRTVYQQAVNEGATFIVGPLTKPQVSELSQEKLSVPTLALNTLDGQQRVNNDLYFFSLSPRDEAEQVAQKAFQDGHHQIIIIAQGTPWGQSIANTFAQRWQELGGQIVDTLAFSSRQDLSESMRNLLKVEKKITTSKGFREAQENKVPLTDLRRQDFDSIFLVASPQQGRLIRPLLRFYFAGNVPVYATSSIYAGVPSPQFDNDLNGVIFADMPWVLDNQSQLPSGMGEVQASVMSLWPSSYNNYAKLYGFGVDAYNLVDDLNRLVSSPQQGISGVTGTLYLGPQHQIFRRMEWARMQSGTPAPL
jgi:outer membrane PBP1 activator LpoA protein